MFIIITAANCCNMCDNRQCYVTYVDQLDHSLKIVGVLKVIKTHTS